MRRELLPLVDHRNANSLATALRRRRFRYFQALIAPLPRPVHILDVGGEQRFWELMGLAGCSEYWITILNLYPPPITHPNLQGVVGDATHLAEFADQSFDCIFSNSVIEHLGTYEKQQRMAAEVRRVGKTYFVQTPNRYFPLEPHFLLPFYQFFPLALQAALLQRFDLGWYLRIPNRQEAIQHIQSHRLLSASEMRALFPDGKLYAEKVLGLTKSLSMGGPASATLPPRQSPKP